MVSLLLTRFHDDLIVCRISLVHENRLDLGREYIDALDDQHIIASAQRLRHFYMGSAAGAFLSAENTDVSGTVTEQRERFLRDAGEYKLSFLSVQEAPLLSQG